MFGLGTATGPSAHIGVDSIQLFTPIKDSHDRQSTPAVETELEKVPEEARQRAERQVASLNAYGYTEVTEAGSLSVGQRVHHVGERYPGASRGTATIERIFTRAGGHDVEVIVRREKPDSPGDTYGFWANYHTIPVLSLAGQP